MVPSFIDDYQGWRKRTGRATAAIVVDSQPDDSGEENKWNAFYLHRLLKTIDSRFTIKGN